MNEESLSCGRREEKKEPKEKGAADQAHSLFVYNVAVKRESSNESLLLG